MNIIFTADRYAIDKLSDVEYSVTRSEKTAMKYFEFAEAAAERGYYLSADMLIQPVGSA